MSLFNSETLPVIFMLLMVVAVFIYTILDGYDLGIGLLLPFTENREEKDAMIRSITPFWDANETWLVLGVGLLLIGFPEAYGKILTTLYLPAVFMLIGLVLRACAFDFRTKAKDHHQALWDKLFFLGSFITTVCQGLMVGMYITGLNNTWSSYVFAVLIGICLCFAYTLLGSSWLILKTEGKVRQNAIHWSRCSLIFAGLAVILVSIATPLTSSIVVEKWFSASKFLWLAPLPLLCGLLFFLLFRLLPKLQKQENHQLDWRPFVIIVAITLLSFIGLTYSIFPDIILGKMTIWEASAAPNSLRFVLFGTVIVLPVIIAYTGYIHYIFWGKSQVTDHY